MNREELDAIRREIDEVDDALVRMLATRRRLVDRAARIKRHARNIVDADRNEAVLANVRRSASLHGLPTGFAERVWRLMTELWIRHQVDLLKPPANDQPNARNSHH